MNSLELTRLERHWALVETVGSNDAPSELSFCLESGVFFTNRHDRSQTGHIKLLARPSNQSLASRYADAVDNASKVVENRPLWLKLFVAVRGKTINKRRNLLVLMEN